MSLPLVYKNAYFRGYLHEWHAKASSDKWVGVWWEWGPSGEQESDATSEEVADFPEERFVEDGGVEATVLPLHLVSHEVMEQLLSGPACKKKISKLYIVDAPPLLKFFDDTRTVFM